MLQPAPVAETKKPAPAPAPAKKVEEGKVGYVTVTFVPAPMQSIRLAWRIGPGTGAREAMPPTAMQMSPKYGTRSASAATTTRFHIPHAPCRACNLTASGPGTAPAMQPHHHDEHCHHHPCRPQSPDAS